jgi:hypothetical protein
MMKNQILGHYRQQQDERCEYLALSFSPLSAPLRSRWRNNGVSADFLGDYVMTFLPADNAVARPGGSQNEIRHAVTYIANEFLENAMKYHERKVDIPIGIRLELTSDRITVTASNGIGSEQADRYGRFVENILNQDAGDLLLRQLEENSAGIDSEASGLGLLTMINDYGARLGWRFEAHTEYPEIMTVTTRAVLDLGNPEGVSA